MSIKYMLNNRMCSVKTTLPKTASLISQLIVMQAEILEIT